MDYHLVLVQLFLLLLLDHFLLDLCLVLVNHSLVLEHLFLVLEDLHLVLVLDAVNLQIKEGSTVTCLNVTKVELLATCTFSACRLSKFRQDIPTC